MLMLVQVLALDRRFGCAGAAAGLMLVQVQALAVDWRFGFVSTVAALMLVEVLALERRFVLRALLPRWCWRWIGFGLPVLAPSWCWRRRWLWIGASFCGRCCRAGACPGMTSCHAQNDILSSCLASGDIMPCRR